MSSEKSLFLAQGLLDRPDDGQQNSTPDAAAQNVADDAADIHSGASHIPETQSVQQLTAETASDDANWP